VPVLGQIVLYKTTRPRQDNGRDLKAIEHVPDDGDGIYAIHKVLKTNPQAGDGELTRKFWDLSVNLVRLATTSV
jgi:hypothetical protein